MEQTQKKVMLLLLLGIIIISSINLVASAPPFTQLNINQNRGLELTYPKYEYIPLNKSFDLFVKVYNISNGLEISNNVDFCVLHMYDKNGTHIIISNMTYNPITNDWYKLIDGANFTKLGIYSFNIYCESGDIGGFEDGIFKLNEYGMDANTFFIYLALYIFLLFISYLLVYKIATHNGKGVMDYSFYFWSGFLDLVLFVIININGFGGSKTLLTVTIEMLAFGSGLYFLSQGIIYATSWGKKRK